jgi:RHS repeat-associated protein
MVSTGTTKLNSYSYDIFGNFVSQQENLPQPFKYSSEMQDGTTGLQYLRARWYDPSMGRFVQEDTETGQVDNPLSENRFTYVENNPLTNIDPTLTDIGAQQPLVGKIIPIRDHVIMVGAVLKAILITKAICRIM